MVHGGDIGCCRFCGGKLGDNWVFCPLCGERIGKAGSGLDLPEVRLDKVKYHWERMHGGRVVFDNFKSVSWTRSESSGIPIRPVLGDFVDVNFMSLRLFGFLCLKPDYLVELMKLHKAFGYYSVYFAMKGAKGGRNVGRDISNEVVWREYLNKELSGQYRRYVETAGCGVIDEVFFDFKKKMGEMVVSETVSSTLRSKKPLCLLEIASACGPLEVVSNTNWAAEEVECAASGGEKCKWVFYPSKTEDFDRVPEFTKEDFEYLLAQSVDNFRNGSKVKRKKLGEGIYIFDDQLLNYNLVSLSAGHNVLSKYSGTIVGGFLVKDCKGDPLVYLKELFEKRRVGLLDVKAREKDKITITLDESVCSAGVKNIHMKLDSFIAGLFEGALKASSGKKWAVDEVKCLANGDDHCEFLCQVR
jgi:predicted hydrocarbon binding protein